MTVFLLPYLPIVFVLTWSTRRYTNQIHTQHTREHCPLPRCTCSNSNKDALPAQSVQQSGLGSTTKAVARTSAMRKRNRRRSMRRSMTANDIRSLMQQQKKRIAKKKKIEKCVAIACLGYTVCCQCDQSMQDQSMLVDTRTQLVTYSKKHCPIQNHPLLLQK